MKYIVIIFFLFLLSCDADTKSNTKVIATPNTMINKQSYPAEIIQLGLKKWYDKTKWNMYCIYSDVTCKFEKQTGIKDTITFASLDLKFEKIEQFSDTTEISFFFYYHDTIKCDVHAVRNLGLASGAGFKKGSDSIYFYTSTSTMHRFWTNDERSRYNNPLQPGVVEYINNNKERLHPWFYDEAMRRGVIK